MTLASEVIYKYKLGNCTEAMIQIAEHARSDPELLKTAPHKTAFGRMDEVKAARELVLCCWPVELGGSRV